ncbi:MAG: methyltransferase [Xanthobacteraceae bacterium]
MDARRPLETTRVRIADRWFDFRTRLLASPAFRRLATAFPLTRPIARRRSRALFDLCAGFVYSQVLLACVRLRLFDILAEGAQPCAALAERLGLPAAGARRLLEAAASLGLLEKRSGDRYGLGQLGAAVLGTPGLAAMIEHGALLYADLADPVALLRHERSSATTLARFWPYAGAERPAALAESEVAGYSALMAATQEAFVAEAVIAAYPFHRHRCVLDIGGGEGVFLSALARRHPHLRLALFDLPAVAERARARFSAQGLGARAQAVGGDFKTDSLPQGADLATLVRVLHDHDDDEALEILRAARRVLPPHGTLLIAEPMAATPGAQSAGAAYFGFYLAAMGRGRPRRFDEMVHLLGAAGFARAKPVTSRNPLLVQMVVARVGSNRGVC